MRHSLHGSTDHPRVCGEKRREGIGYGLVQGSPPRVRGEACVGSGRLQHRRITPACAGRSLEHLQYRRQFEDHPRVCGEKF